MMVFDCIERIDTSPKRRTDSIFSHWNNSARPSTEASRALIEEWFSRVPTAEQEEFRSRFRCGGDEGLAAAFQELCLHEFFLQQACLPSLHPAIAGTTKRPDFLVREPDESEFLMEARSSTEISSGPENSPRRNRVLDFLQGFKPDGFLLGVDEVTAGSDDLSQKFLAGHINRALNRTGVSRTKDGRVLIPLVEANGWRIRLTAIPDTPHGTRSGSVLYEGWGRTWAGPSYPLLNALKKKAGRYGSELSMPFVVAVNSLDPMLGDRDFHEPLFGEHGLWGTSGAPKYTRVSAVLFTKNLWPETLLMGQVESRLYLNPFAGWPLKGVLTKLDTFRFEADSWRKNPGQPLHKLLHLRQHSSSPWN
jgi:hypothetical protein